MKRNTLKSIFIVIAGFLFLTSAVSQAKAQAPPQAPSTPTKTETYRDIIEKAHNLSLQKERAHAVQLLNSSIQRESKKGPVPRDLTQALEEVSTLFMSDKAQQQFELALSLRADEPQLAQQKLADAAKIEPDNLQIQLEQFRVATILGGCSESAAGVLRLGESYGSLEVVRLAMAQAQLCQGQVDEALKLRSAVELKKSAYPLFWQMLEAEGLHRSGKGEKALELLTSVQKNYANFPESYYWQWKIERDLKKLTERPAQKYVSLCKSISPRAYRQYLAEAFLCRRLQEVETSLKKNNNPPS